ncbi:beta-lactamase family protein [Kribbella qitaiheensis]|uniref:beta-lactamase family protein n=1 Tax=Kribbella qitaiheensis TaxID=1544730 RepID=UPI001FEAD08A|nr:beta-lactamase family protein [Kribbella qitaiheensis]
MADRVSAPFEMDSTRFGPLPADVVARCAPTEFDAEAGLRIKGTPHDYSARLLAVCGIAGVFSTAADLGRFLQHLLWAQDPLASWVAESLTVQTGSLGPARGFFWQPASGSDPVEDVWVHYGLPVQQCGSRPRSAGGQR